MIRELQLVFIVKDKDVGEELGITHIFKYTWAMMKLFQWRQQKSVNLVHSMVEIKTWPILIGKNQRFLIKEKIYSLAHIIKRSHVILAVLLQVQYWFVNNYIDWD